MTKHVKLAYIGKQETKAVMKKIFVLCLFVILSLGLFAQKIKSDGKPHFDKILWELWAEKSPDYDGPSGWGLVQIVKIDNDY